MGALTACAPLQTTPAPVPVGRAQLVLPPGEWVDLGASDQALTLLPEVGATLPLQTRTVGLRGPDSAWLAVLQVQTNHTNYPHPEIRWTDTCPAQQGVWVEDATAVTTAKGTLTSHVRIDCLRFKRLANYEGWMEKNQPVLAQWLSSHSAAPNLPYAHLHYRYATQGGAYVDIQAVVDQRLLRPPTSNNQEFLAAGRPGQAWSHALALAGRQSTALLDGMLAVPPFPIALSH
ncbi:hypothetical protein [Simplicispira psychrophila]|uniref:hypothetical protein n=1 Tax=Simplicispira psychrophila TaxID=80882 RepID=UPI001B804E6A|nr:hypothetical protein [Simplicispira psychrophila]